MIHIVINGIIFSLGVLCGMLIEQDNKRNEKE